MAFNLQKINETTLGGPWGKRKREHLSEVLVLSHLPLGVHRHQVTSGNLWEMGGMSLGEHPNKIGVMFSDYFLH